MSKQNNWTPEPWVTDGPKVEGNSPGAMHDIAICPTHAHLDWTGGDNGHRIVACVNACKGMPEPDKEIKALREVAEACEKLRSQWTQQHVATTALDFAVVDVILALAALKAEGEGKT